MLSNILIFFPLIAALLMLAFKGETAKRVALIATLIELGVAIYAYTVFKANPQDSALGFDTAWIGSGIRYHVGIDGISLMMLLLTTVLMPFIVLSTFERKVGDAFFSLMFVMQMALVGVFLAYDGFLFYIFWELALIPIYLICLMYGGENRGKITFKFFVYTLAGSLLMLVGLLYCYMHTPGTHSFDLNALYAAGKQLSANEQGWVFWAIFLAFAIKMPIFPFHTWQPDTYVTAPTQGTMLLSGIMLKMGTFGLIRWLIPMVPQGFQDYAHIAIILSVIGIIYASLIAFVQQDYKRLIAYSSIAHVGLISAGILAFNLRGVTGGVVQMLSHGINVVALFYLCDIIAQRTNTRDINSLGGIRNVAPNFALVFLIVLLGSVALPLTNGFVGEFLLLLGISQYHSWIAGFAGLTIILGAVYMLRSYQAMILGEVNDLTATFADLTTIEKCVLYPLVAMIIFFGVYPAPILEILEPAVKTLLYSQGAF